MLDLTTIEAPQFSQNFPHFPAAKKSSQLGTVGLNDKQRAAIELLAMGKCYKAAAKELNIDRRTLFNWRKDELFQSELQRRHQEMWGDVNDRLRMLVDPSVEVLAEHLCDQYDRNRFRAAATILRIAKLRVSPSDRD